MGDIRRLERSQKVFKLETLEFGSFHLAIFLLMILGLVTLIITRSIESHIKQDVKNSIHTLLTSTHEAFYNWEEAKKSIVSSYIRHNLLISHVTAELLDKKIADQSELLAAPQQYVLRRLFESLLQEKSIIDFSIINPDGIVVSSKWQSSIGFQTVIRQQPEMLERAFRGETLVTSVIAADRAVYDEKQDYVNKAPAIFVLTPVRDPLTNKTMAVTSVRLYTEKGFSEIAQHSYLGKTGQTYLYTPEGRLQTHVRFQDQLVQLGLLLPYESDILSLVLRDPGGDLTQGYKPERPRDEWPLTNIVPATRTSGAKSAVFLTPYRDYRGKSVIGGWLYDERTNLYLATEQEADEAFSTLFLFQTLLWSAVGFSAVILVILAIVFSYGRRLAIQLAYGLTEELNDQNVHLERMVDEKTKGLLNAKIQAEAANQAKSDFLANMTHELRTPLHGILSFANMGLEKAQLVEREKLQRYFSRIAESGDRLLNLVNDLLDLSKLEAHRMVLDCHPCDLQGLFKSVKDEMTLLLNKKMISIKVDNQNARLAVEMDRNRIYQVVINLLSNAIKYSPEHGIILVKITETKLSLGRRSTDLDRLVDAVSISISDQGVGIPKDELDTVFDKFIQSSTTKSGAGGTGLGLAICKEIVELHQGTIKASQAPGGGACFTVVLPYRQPEL